jgi:sortase A
MTRRLVHPRVLRILSTALITAGLVVLADVALTLAWKEPMSTIYGSIQQGRAEDELAELERSFRSRVMQLDRSTASGGEAEGPGQRRTAKEVAALARAFAQEVTPGRAIGRIEIARIDLDGVVVEGTDTETLRKGPGRYPDTAFPGQGKTIGIAGHRTTYLAPFRHIDELEAGDEIVIEMPYATFTYEVQKHAIVEPWQVGIVRDVGYERLVLTACHPLYSAAQRYAVFAKRIEIS